MNTFDVVVCSDIRGLGGCIIESFTDDVTILVIEVDLISGIWAISTPSNVRKLTLVSHENLCENRKRRLRGKPGEYEKQRLA